MSQPLEPYKNYYLQVEALTPQQATTTAATTQPKTPAKFVFPTTPLLVSLAIATPLLVLAALADLHYKSTRFLKASFKISLLAVVIPFGVALIGQVTQLGSKAGPEHTPKQLAISDLNSNSFIASWQTSSPAVGAARLQNTTTKKSQTLSDTTTSPSTQHQFTFTELEPETTYQLTILSEGVWYDNQGQPIEITTPK